MIISFRDPDGLVHGEVSGALASFALNCLRGREVRVVVAGHPMITGRVRRADATSLVVGLFMMQWTIPFTDIVAVRV